MPRRVRALHLEQLIVLRQVLQLAPRLAFGRTHKQFRPHGLSEPVRLCFLIRLDEIPVRGFVNRKPWVQPKTRCSRREPMLSEDLVHHCILPIPSASCVAQGVNLRPTTDSNGSNLSVIS